jgi:DNA-3-methyladenine glycosylase
VSRRGEGGAPAAPARAGLSRRRLRRAFYLRSAVEVAPDLIGRVLVHERDGVRLAGRILETEAYQGADDLASHASRGRTARTEPMFWRGGHAYIYLVYGMHLCFNVVTGLPDHPEAVLIRAIEPLDGIDRMRALCPRCAPPDLGRGPGRLGRARGLARALDRADLCRRGLHLEEGAAVPRRRVATGARVGVDYAGEWAGRPWRFAWRGHPGLSRPI